MLSVGVGVGIWRIEVLGAGARFFYLSGSVCYIDISRRSCRDGEEVMVGQR